MNSGQLFTKAFGFIKIKLSGKVEAYKLCQYQSEKQNMKKNRRLKKKNLSPLLSFSLPTHLFIFLLSEK